MRLRGAEDRAELLMGSERQILISWSGRDGEPRFEGDPSIAGDGATREARARLRLLARAGRCRPRRGALDQLRQRGEGFRLTARTLAHAFIDAEGRTIGGRAILRLRDVTGDRAELLRARSELAAARARAPRR